jgi:hypothetical protein
VRRSGGVLRRHLDRRMGREEPCEEAVSEMVVRVARAIVGEESWPHCTGMKREAAMFRARAAIEAMREPTEEMKQAGDWMREHLDEEPHPHEINDSIAIWRAMIDAALAKE